MADNDIILKEEKDGAVILTLNRPESMNSINFDLLHAMHAHLDELEFDSTVRSLIITGKGEKAFCAGADLKERATLNENQVKLFIRTIRDLSAKIDNFPKPVIAAVNGVALGGGTELALASDIRIVSDNASMGLTETRLAIIPGGGGTQRLPRIVGIAKAKEMIFTGKRIGAEEALSIGLANHISPADSLMEECLKMTDMIDQTGPIAVEQAKYAINKGMETDIHTGLAIESNAYRITIPTQDRVEGLTAFREKRKPVYKGK